MKTALTFGIIGIGIGGFFLTRDYYLNEHKKKMEFQKNSHRYKIVRFYMKQGESKEKAENMAKIILA